MIWGHIAPCVPFVYAAIRACMPLGRGGGGVFLCCASPARTVRSIVPITSSSRSFCPLADALGCWRSVRGVDSRERFAVFLGFPPVSPVSVGRVAVRAAQSVCFSCRRTALLASPGASDVSSPPSHRMRTCPSLPDPTTTPVCHPDARKFTRTPSPLCGRHLAVRSCIGRSGGCFVCMRCVFLGASPLLVGSWLVLWRAGFLFQTW